ncbi:MAG: DUF1343 domain-containing protein [Candidatus Eremiobacteraeota bacterium]|nr:DUF1343 domain-containing protein [Candidatus Eremiobacteraeota bacterium]
MFRVVLALCLVCCALQAAAAASRDAAVSLGSFSDVDVVVDRAVAQGEIPGAVLIVGHNGKIVHRKAFGWRALEPRRERMSENTIFDMASLTKSMATAPSIMLLEQQGRLKLNDTVATYFPQFAAQAKDDITVRELLTHFSGLRGDLDLSSSWRGYAQAIARAAAERPVISPGAQFLYSDINYIVAGELVRRISGQPLDEYARRNFYQPLGMAHTRFKPPAAWLGRIAPTEYDERGTMLRGVVHDPTARRMGGVAGHAGLFSDADDVARFAQWMLDAKRILSPPIFAKMTTPQQPPTSTVLRGLGWDIDSPYSTNRGELFPIGSFGHTGFTGTSLWIDPSTQTYVVLLTNAVHPRGGGPGIISLRTKVATAVAAALGLRQPAAMSPRFAAITGYNEAAAGRRLVRSRNGSVRLGIDVMEATGFTALSPNAAAPRKVGLLTNQTGVDTNGRRTIDVLAHASGLRLSAIFSPEHGVAGTLDTTAIGNTLDAASGVPVYSVYGATDAQRRPSIDILKTLDAVVIDIQDVGVRYYTYETTMGYFLEAAAKAGIEVIVLDRPDPITGSLVQGPLSQASANSFVDYYPLPVRHGMTMGELAELFNAERHIGARLRVVKMEGWMRGDWFDATGLQWINPSPNMRSLTEATLYPGIGLIEGSNVSVGRGTDTPFELVCAPWIDGRRLAAYLNERFISGVRFVPVTVTPAASKYAGRSCHGVNILVLERYILDAPELGLEIASALHKLYSQDYQLDDVRGLVSDDAIVGAIKTGEDPRRIAAGWSDALESFMQRRSRYLLY